MIRLEAVKNDKLGDSCDKDTFLMSAIVVSIQESGRCFMQHIKSNSEINCGY